MADRYPNFAALAEERTRHVDYRIICERRPSPAAVIAPHGGRIEPVTSRIARAVAADTENLYCFEGLTNEGDLHITSHHFDEPQCIELISECSLAVSIHGLLAKTRPDGDILVGGLDAALRDSIANNLNNTGVRTRIILDGSLSAEHPMNIVNRTKSKMGAQIEICRGLRDQLRREKMMLATFAASIRDALTSVRKERKL